MNLLNLSSVEIDCALVAPSIPVLVEVKRLWDYGNLSSMRNLPGKCPSSNDPCSEDELSQLILNGDVEKSQHSSFVDFALPKQIGIELSKGLLKQFPNLDPRPSGSVFYGPKDFMRWHTNSNSPGIRLYFTHADEDHKSFFRYRNPFTGQVITSWDTKGWQCRAFDVSKNSLFWHCIHSDTNRLSVGIKLSSTNI